MNESTTESSIDLGAFNQLCEQLKEAKTYSEECKAQEKESTSLLEVKKKEVLKMMVHHEMDKYSIPSGGTLSVQNKFSIKVPKTEEQRTELFDYLKQKEIFESTITINSATLNALYKATMEEAVERGDVDFAFPGIEEPKHYQALGIRK